METEKMNVTELNEKELEQVSGGFDPTFKWGLFKQLYMQRINPPGKYPELHRSLLNNEWGKAEVCLIQWIAKGEKDLIQIFLEVRDSQ